MGQPLCLRYSAPNKGQILTSVPGQEGISYKDLACSSPVHSRSSGLTSDQGLPRGLSLGKSVFPCLRVQAMLHRIYKMQTTVDDYMSKALASDILVDLGSE